MIPAGWWIHVESVLIGGGFSWGDIQECPAADVYAHLVQCFRRDAQRRSWELTAHSYPHLTQTRDRMRVQAGVRRLEHTGRRIATALEIVGEARRVELIGSLVKGLRHKGGTLLADWMQCHPQHVQFLAANGVTLDEAVRRHEAALAREAAHSFWGGGDSQGIGNRRGKRTRKRGA